MAQDTQTSTSTEPTSQTQLTSESEPWTPDQLEAALAHLETLQEQLDNLRSAIPGLVKPLRTPPSSANEPERAKAKVYMDLRRSAARRNEDLRLLREAWEGDEVKEVFERCRESERGDGDLSKAWEVERWGWRESVEGKGA